MATNASSSSKIDLCLQNLNQAMKISQIWIYVKLKYISELGLITSFHFDFVVALLSQKTK